MSWIETKQRQDVSPQNASDYPVFNRKYAFFQAGGVLGKSPIISGHASDASNHVSDRQAVRDHGWLKVATGTNEDDKIRIR